MKYLLIILSFQLVFAQNATTLQKGDIAPHSGILLTKERAEQAMKAEKKVIVLEDLKLTQDQLIDYHKEDAMRQRRKLSKAEFDSNVKAIGMFVLGVVLAGVAFKLSDKIGAL